MAAPKPRVETLLFDLDGTLYSNTCGYVKHFRARAVEYLCNKFGWTPEEAEAKRKEALRVRNQTVLGLKALGHDFDDFEFVEYMREGEDRFLEPNPTLRAMLEALPQKKYIFTNTRSEPAKRALKCLGIEDLFAGVYGADFTGDVCKPQAEAFRMVMEDCGAKAESSAMFEDSLRNVVAAKELGMTTVFITCGDAEIGAAEMGEGFDVTTVADAVIPDDSLDEATLKGQLPHLF